MRLSSRDSKSCEQARVSPTPVASWFETRVTALLTTRDEDLILRSSAKRCVSKDEAPNTSHAVSAFISL
jgi:hypothetical protein